MIRFLQVIFFIVTILGLASNLLTFALEVLRNFGEIHLLRDECPVIQT